jgi:hypothetical protein
MGILAKTGKINKSREIIQKVSLFILLDKPKPLFYPFHALGVVQEKDKHPPRIRVRGTAFYNSASSA